MYACGRAVKLNHVNWNGMAQNVFFASVCVHVQPHFMIVRICNVQSTPATIPGHSKWVLQTCLTPLSINVPKGKEVLLQAGGSC